MKTYFTTALAFTVSVLGSLTLLGCSDPVFREAFYRGIAGAYYQRSQNPYVHPLGRASESFAAGFFSTMADAERQQRLAQDWQAREAYRQQWQAQAEETYRESADAQRQQRVETRWRGAEPAPGFKYKEAADCNRIDGPLDSIQQRLCPEAASRRAAIARDPEKLRRTVIRAREEIEQFLKADREVFRQWADFLPQWLSLLERSGATKSRSSHYALSKKLHQDMLVVDSRASFYLGNLPAYIHEKMDVEMVRTEMQDYLSKRKDVIALEKKWNDDFNTLVEEAKKREEEIKRIEAEQRTF